MQQKNAEQAGVDVVKVDIGSLLLNNREASGVCLKTAAKAVNLSANIIEKLESNQFSQIGKNVYVRGYLGLYSKYLGLDVAQIVNVYDKQYPAEPVAIRPALACQYKNNKQVKRHSKTFSFLLAASVFFGLLYGYKHFEPTIFGGSKKNDEIINGSTGESQSPVDVIVDEVNGARVIADDALNGVSVANQGGELVSELNLNGLESVLDADFSDQNQTDAVTEGQSDEAKANLVTEPSEDNDQKPEENTAESQAAKLEFDFKDECWLELKDATGKIHASGIYSPQRSLKVSGKLPFELTMARKNAVKKIIFDGKTVKLDGYKVSQRRYLIK